MWKNCYLGRHKETGWSIWSRYYENVKIIKAVINNDIWSKWLEMCKNSKLTMKVQEGSLSSPEKTSSQDRLLPVR